MVFGAQWQAKSTIINQLQQLSLQKTSVSCSNVCVSLRNLSLLTGRDDKHGKSEFENML